MHLQGNCALVNVTKYDFISDHALNFIYKAILNASQVTCVMMWIKYAAVRKFGFADLAKFVPLLDSSGCGEQNSYFHL